MEEIMTTKEVAETLRCSSHQVGYMRKFGLITGTKFGKNWIYYRKDIMDFMANSKGMDFSNFREMTPLAAQQKYLKAKTT